MMTLIIPRKEAPVSGEGTVVIPQPAGDEPVIKNTFFFPDIDPKRVRERMRLEQTVAPARSRMADRRRCLTVAVKNPRPPVAISSFTCSGRITANSLPCRISVRCHRTGSPFS